ncbi:MAG: hypothetical protein QM737_22750 [Ferruginibacter sp.]
MSKTKYGVHVSKDVETLTKELKAEYKLSDYEALTLALKAEQNELFRRAFVLSNSDDYPSGLEAIAIALGFKK